MIFYSLINGGYQFMYMRIVTGTNNTSNSIKVTEGYGVSKKRLRTEKLTVNRSIYTAFT